MRFLDFLLLVLLPQVRGEDEEPVFRAAGSVIELGYCFGVDYIVVYRSGPKGDQLLGNSSAEHTPIPPPADLQGRIRINQAHQLLGLQISNLTHLDSGMYRRECWQNQTLVSQQVQQLSVCDEEVSAEEIIQKQEEEVTQLRCNHTSLGEEGATVRWFREIYPTYKATLFLDSSVSLSPLLEELQGVMEVREGGALLLLNSNVLKTNQHFNCLVMKNKKCASFQNLFLPDHSESKEVFTSLGDRLVLTCPAEGTNQQWETPLGRMGINSTNNELMSMSLSKKSRDFSLVIPSVSKELSGDYSCVSSSLEVMYTLILCPKKEAQKIVFTEGRDVLLECNVGKETFQKVQWYRLDPAGKHELIHDSDDNMGPVPLDLIGQLTLSRNSSLLTITNLEEKDGGVYWCLVLGGLELLEEIDYKEDYDVDYTDEVEGEVEGEGEGEGEVEGEDEGQFSEDPFWGGPNRCIFKQETILTLTADPEPPGDEESKTATTIGVGVGLGLLALVVAVVVAVIVLKKRQNSSSKPTAACSAQNAPSDIKLDVDPGCADPMLNQRGENGD